MIRKYPLAFVSFIIGVLSFVHLFGLEKALLAVILGAFALKEVPLGEEKGKKYACIGIVIGSLYILVLTVIMLIKGPEIISTFEGFRR